MWDLLPEELFRAEQVKIMKLVEERYSDLKNEIDTIARDHHGTRECGIRVYEALGGIEKGVESLALLEVHYYIVHGRKEEDSHSKRVRSCLDYIIEQTTLSLSVGKVYMDTLMRLPADYRWPVVGD